MEDQPPATAGGSDLISILQTAIESSRSSRASSLAGRGRQVRSARISSSNFPPAAKFSGVGTGKCKFSQEWRKSIKLDTCSPFKRTSSRSGWSRRSGRWVVRSSAIDERLNEAKRIRPHLPIQRATGGRKFGSYQPSSNVTAAFRSRHASSLAVSFGEYKARRSRCSLSKDPSVACEGVTNT